MACRRGTCHHPSFHPPSLSTSDQEKEHTPFFYGCFCTGFISIANHSNFWSLEGDEQVYATFKRIHKSKLLDFLGNEVFLLSACSYCVLYIVSFSLSRRSVYYVFSI